MEDGETQDVFGDELDCRTGRFAEIGSIEDGLNISVLV